MRHELKFAELQTPLFMEGVNHGVKLYKDAKGIKMFWDDAIDKLILIFKGNVSILPLGNVATMNLVDPSPFLPEMSTVSLLCKESEIQLVEPAAPTTPATKKPYKTKAQVSTPTSHVFSGEKEQ